MESSSDDKVVYFNLFIVKTEDGQKIVFASNYPYYYESIIAQKYRKQKEVGGLKLRTVLKAS